MQELEDNLLYRLTSTRGSLVEGRTSLALTKETAEEVSEKLSIAEETERKTSTSREEYRPVASRASILYFLITDISLVNVMHQTSLAQVLEVFDQSIQKSAKSPVPAKRIADVIDYLTCAVYCYAARGFYEEHKYLFTLLLARKINLQSGKISFTEFDIFIKGGATLDLNSVEPKPKKRILDVTWLNLIRLSSLPMFKQLPKQVAACDKANRQVCLCKVPLVLSRNLTKFTLRCWKSWFDEDAAEEHECPEGCSKSLDTFRKLLLFRSWCPDRTTTMARYYIMAFIGKGYADGVTLNLEKLYEESNIRTPMTCLLSMGSDRTEQIEKLAKKCNTRCRAISMGQEQEVHARRILQQSMQEGRWVLFQNCHLGLMFMDELLESMRGIAIETCHPSRRIFITAKVIPKFPITLLQSSTNFTNESSQGMKAGMGRTFASVTQDQLEVTNMPQWCPLLYTSAFLHSVVQERRKFGPLGWNTPYEFNQSDFTASVQFIQNHLDDIDPKKGVSFKTVKYMIGEVNYGGRVTDDFDKRLLNTFCKVWFGEHVFDPKFAFFAKGGYVIPLCTNIDDRRNAIKNLPNFREVFRIYPNADIAYQTNTSNQVSTSMQSIQRKDSSGRRGETREAVVDCLPKKMLEKLPEEYLPYQVKESILKMRAADPSNIFLWQETSWDSSSIGFWFSGLLDRNEHFRLWLFDGKPN